MRKVKPHMSLWFLYLLLISGCLVSAYNIDLAKDDNASTSYNAKLSEKETFFGEWKLKEMSWYNEYYFASEPIQKEMNSKIGQPIDGVTIYIQQNEYKEIDEKNNFEFIISSPDYSVDDLSAQEDEKVYNTINNVLPYFKKNGLDTQNTLYLIVRDPMKRRMDSGEIDWYYIPTTIFIRLDENTLLFTNETCVELYICERIAN